MFDFLFHAPWVYNSVTSSFLSPFQAWLLLLISYHPEMGSGKWVSSSRLPALHLAACRFNDMWRAPEGWPHRFCLSHRDAHLIVKVEFMFFFVYIAVCFLSKLVGSRVQHSRRTKFQRLSRLHSFPTTGVNNDDFCVRVIFARAFPKCGTMRRSVNRA